MSQDKQQGDVPTLGVKHAQEKFPPSHWGKFVSPKEAHLFAAATQLYGWTEHEHHFPNKPVMLSKEEFGAAIKAAAEYPNGSPPMSAFGTRAGERFKKKIEAKEAQKKAAEEQLAKKGGTSK